MIFKKIEKEIFFYGMSRSGSTLVHRALRYIFTPNPKSGHNFVKTQKPLVIVYRDFRDLTISYWRIFYGKYNRMGSLINQPTKKELLGCADGIKKQIKTLNKFKEHYKNQSSVLWLQYEKFFLNYNYLFNEIEQFCNITISENLRNFIELRTNLDSAKIIQKRLELENEDFGHYDKDTLIHSHHIYNGKVGSWKEIVQKDYHDSLNSFFKKELIDWGYKCKN
ncbi:hypothetical protein LCGC14_0943350 [marine sediment metagenome]|uniref:Sulfotransferase domain-containing protein n=1 Tax=marine sediment metagenome TaxID=412755 RepID=A0A0F9P5F9_9ZZZZ